MNDDYRSGASGLPDYRVRDSVRGPGNPLMAIRDTPRAVPVDDLAVNDGDAIRDILDTPHDIVSSSRALTYMSGMEHGMVAVVGSGKQGKSCSLHSLIALCWPKRRVVMLDPMDIDISIFPGYTRASSPSEVPVGAVAVIEDVNRVFHSRGSGKDPTLQKWLGIISHRSNVVCITSQSLAATDMEFLRSQDSVIVNKTMHEEDLAFERPEFRSSQALANEWISIAHSRHPPMDRRSWCFFPRFNEVVSVPKVPWWGYLNSHMLRWVEP